MLIVTDGKVKIARYRSSPKAIEPIYSLLELIFNVQLLREQERVVAFAL